MIIKNNLKCFKVQKDGIINVYVNFKVPSN